MKLSEQTIKAIVYNIIVPGAGYLYIGAKNRYPLAIFLVYGTLNAIIYTINNLIQGKTGPYAVDISIFFPALIVGPLGIILITLLMLDTYYLARKLPAKPKPHNTIFNEISVILRAAIKNIMHSPKRSKIAIVLNIFLPGAGYFYIRAKKRYLLATFLLGSTIYSITHITLHLTSTVSPSTVTISPYFLLFVVAPLGVIFMAMVVADTYYLARRLVPKPQS